MSICNTDEIINFVESFKPLKNVIMNASMYSLLEHMFHLNEVIRINAYNPVKHLLFIPAEENDNDFHVSSIQKISILHASKNETGSYGEIYQYCQLFSG